MLGVAEGQRRAEITVREAREGNIPVELSALFASFTMKKKSAETSELADIFKGLDLLKVGYLTM